MDNGDITRYIVAELRKYRDPNDVISNVCERYGMRWADAQQFVERVQSERIDEVTGLHNPYLIIFGIGTIIVGRGLLIGPFVLLLVTPSEALAKFFAYFSALGLLMIIGGAVGLLSMALQKK